jgi:hypothetical protein
MFPPRPSSLLSSCDCLSAVIGGGGELDILFDIRLFPLFPPRLLFRLRFRERICDTSVPGTSADGRHVPVLCVDRAEIGVPCRRRLSRALGPARDGKAHAGRRKRRRRGRPRRGCRRRQQRRPVRTGWHARRTLSQVPSLLYGQGVGKAR